MSLAARLRDGLYVLAIVDINTPPFSLSAITYVLVGRQF